VDVDVVVLTEVEEALGELALASDPRQLPDDHVVDAAGLDPIAQLAKLLAGPAVTGGSLL
jgi:hypothetical protein